LETKIVSERKTFEYATEEVLPVDEKFARTKKSGYVEEQVDIYVQNVIKDYTSFLNKYNDVVFEYITIVEEIKPLEEENADLRRQLEGKAHYISPEELADRMEARFAAQKNDVVDNSEEIEGLEARIAELEAEIEEKNNQIKVQLNVEPELVPEYHYDVTVPAGAPLQPPVPEQAPTVVNETKVIVDLDSATDHAKEVLNVAAVEAAELIARVFERVNVLEKEAEADAAETLRKADEYVETSVAKVNDYTDKAIAKSDEYAHATKEEADKLAESIKNEAIREANEAVESKNQAIAERDAILGRLELFYGSQLHEIKETKNSVGYSPLLEINSNDASVEEVEEEDAQEEETVVESEETPVSSVEAVEDVYREDSVDESSVEETPLEEVPAPFTGEYVYGDPSEDVHTTTTTVDLPEDSNSDENDEHKN
jgi:hypothetical protein